MLTLYGAPSSRTRRCIWILEHVGATYEFERINFATGDHRAPEYLKLNPNARVPTLVDSDAGITLYESGAICQYVARNFSDANLLPQEPSEQALHDQWMFWLTSELEQPLWSMGKHRFALPKAQRIPQMQATALFEWQRATPVLAAALAEGGPFLLGETLCVADFIAAHTLLWARGFGVDFGHDELEQYLERMRALDSYAKAKRFD